MADISWLAAVKFGVTTGLVTGMANQGFGMLRERWERRFRREERIAQEQAAAEVRREERQDAALLRREAAHDAAKDAFVPKAEELLAWAEWTATQAHTDEGGDFHYVGAKRSTLSDETAAIKTAREIATGHPSGHVRSKAEQIYTSLISFYGEMRPDGNYAPTFDEAYSWEQSAEELLRRIHSPEEGA